MHPILKNFLVILWYITIRYLFVTVVTYDTSDQKGSVLFEYYNIPGILLALVVLILVPWAWVHIVHLTKKDSDFQGTIVKVDQTERSDGSTDNPIINK